MNPTTARWFAEYAGDHQHPMNRLTHKLAIPGIVFHVIAMLTWVPLPGGAAVAGFPVTLALVGWLAGAAFWIWALPRSGGLLAALTLPVAIWGGMVPAPFVITLALVAWTVQLAGHKVWEKNKPSFLKNAAHAMVGPLFFAALLTGELPVRAPASQR